MAKYRKLGRTSDQRKALLRNQVTALLYNGKIVTTEARAKEVRKIAEHLKYFFIISVSGLSCRKCDTRYSYIDEVINSFPMESPEPFFYFHPFHWNIYICYELNEFL